MAEPQAKSLGGGMPSCHHTALNFMWSRASDKCQREKRKTINGEDLLWAMAHSRFLKNTSNEPLKVYLTRYREGAQHMMVPMPGTD